MKKPTPPILGTKSLDVRLLAQSIAPKEEVPLLLSGLPPWLQQRVDAPHLEKRGSLTDLTLRLGRALSADTALSPEGIDLLVDLLRWAKELEAQPTCGSTCLSQRAMIYRTLDFPFFGDREGFFGHLFQTMAEILANQGAEAQQAAELVSYIQGVFARAPLLHRKVLAQLLTENPDNPNMMEFLGQLARLASQDEDFGLAKKVRSHILRQKGENSLPEDWLDLAESCYLAIDIECGDQALATLESFSTLTKHQHERRQKAEARAAIARELQKLPKATTLEDTLRQTLQLGELGRKREARELLQKLAQAHPRDARPWAGLARLEIERFRTKQALELIRQASKLENKNRDYYEMAVGLVFSSFIHEVIVPAAKDPESLPSLVQPILKSLDEPLAGLAQFDPARAEILQLLVETAFQVFRFSTRDDLLKREQAVAFADTTLPKFWALREKWPREPFAHNIPLALLRITDNRVLARHIALFPISANLPQRHTLLYLQAHVLLALAVSWSDITLVASLQKILQDLDRSDIDTWTLSALHADAMAFLACASRQKADWLKTELAYRNLLPKAPQEEQGRVMNNLGVALFRLGKQDEARKRWQDAIDANSAQYAPDLNLLVTGPLRPVAQADLADLIQTAGNETLKYQTRRWMLQLYPPANPAEAKKLRQEALAALEQGNELVQPTTGDLGAFLQDSLKFSLGYSTIDRLITRCDLEVKLWLIVPAQQPQSRDNPAQAG